MCMFWIIATTDNLIMRKGVVFCQNGYRGSMCIDPNKIWKYPQSSTISARSGDILINAGGSMSLILENILHVCQVTIEYSLVKPYAKQMKSMNPEQIYDMYTKIKDGVVVYPESVISNTAYHENDRPYDIPVRRSKTLPSVAPSDSISQVSHKSMRKIEELPNEDTKSSISKWAEESSVATKASKSTVKASRETQSTVSKSSRASSRRSSSYAMARQMVIAE